MKDGMSRVKVRAQPRDDRGAVLVEAAFILPVVILIVFGIIEFGLAFKDTLTVRPRPGPGPNRHRHVEERWLPLGDGRRGRRRARRTSSPTSRSSS